MRPGPQTPKQPLGRDAVTMIRKKRGSAWRMSEDRPVCVDIVHRTKYIRS
jgi:hypothetical protein